MRRIATNLFQHRNGVYYARFKRAGKTHLVSLRTRNAKKARAALPAVLRPIPVEEAQDVRPEEILGATGKQMIAEVMAQVMKAEFLPLINAMKASATPEECLGAC